MLLFMSCSAWILLHLPGRGPHTIYVYGTDEIQGVPVITMELAPGGTLKELVTQRGALPPAQAVDIILQIAAGLEAAADAGVLHRDVKPANCFVDTDGTVKVGDFGLSISTVTDERSLAVIWVLAIVLPFLAEERKELAVMRSPRGILSLVLLCGCGAFAIVGAFGLLSAGIFRGGLELRLFGAAVVTKRGHDAGRLRALIAWSPAILGVIGLVMADDRLMDGRAWIPCLLGLVLLLAGAIYAVRNPHRGLQDRLAGTVLVPR
jgi:hypothetical protein